jgi:hypothetical protein
MSFVAYLLFMCGFLFMDCFIIDIVLALFVVSSLICPVSPS